MALCLNCGGIKFGAFCACPKCKTESVGDRMMDMAFSDHFMGLGTLARLGAVVREIRLHCDDPKSAMGTFVYYVSKNHPEILRQEIGPEQLLQAEAVLDKCDLSEESIKASMQKAVLEAFGEEAGGDGGNEKTKGDAG